MQKSHELPSAGVLATVGRDLCGFLADHSVDIAPLAQATGFEIDEFSSLDKRVDLDRFCRLMEVSATITNLDDFGIRYSDYYNTGGTGAFAQGLLAAPTMKDMLIYFARYIDTVVDHRQFNLTFERQSVAIDWEYPPVVRVPQQFTDFSLNQVIKVISLLTSQRQRFVGFTLMRAPPFGKTLHRQAFPAPITYEGRTNRMIMSANHLTEKNPFANPVLFELMSRECDRQLSDRKDSKSLTDVLREHIIEALSQGGMPIDKAAARVGLSRRTMQRRLSAAGLTYESLVEETRFALVKLKLGDQGIPFAIVAEQVGYSDQSAFTRAVARHFGATPTQLRNRMVKRQEEQ